MLGDDDDGWGRRGFGVYPTLINREGPDVGRAQENGMARGVTWPNGCQTVEFQNHDGSVTTYRTHGGMPQVTTNELVVDAPVCIVEELTSPLTETSYAARTYHADERLFSMNGMYSIPLKPINRITVTTGDTVPQTRAICLAQNDSTTGVRVNDTDLVETSRTYSPASHYQRVYINGTFIPCGFDARLTDIALAGKCGRPLTLKVYPTGGTAGTHGSIFGDHVLGSATITSFRVMGLNAKTNVTLKKFEIVLSSPGKFFERIENAAWTVLNNLTTPAPNAPFPWERRLLKFAGLKCFQRVNGNLYTDQTLTTLLDASLRPASFQADTEFGPRYFKFTANADYTLPTTNWKFPGDAIFPRKMFCFPEAVYSARMNPFRLLPTEHIFKCAAGQVWKIGVTLTAGAGATDNYKIYLRNRFDPILESVSTVNLLLAEVNAKNWSAYPSAPTGSPTLRPTSFAFVSKADGTEAYLIGYWEDLFLFPTGERKRTITSALRVQFIETGTSDPATGVGLSATVTERDVFADFVNTVVASNTSTMSSGAWANTSVDIGTCGSSTLHELTQVYVTIPGVVAFSESTQFSYKRLLWIVVGSDGQFDFISASVNMHKTINDSGTLDTGTITYVITDYCDAGTPKYTGVGTGSQVSATVGTTVYDWWIEAVSSVRGVLLPKIGTVLTIVDTRDYWYEYAQTWAYPAGPHAGFLRGTQVKEYTNTFYGGVSPSTASTFTHDYEGVLFDSETGSRYMPLTDINDEFTTLFVQSGAAYHATELRLWEYIDGAITDYTPGPTPDGFGPKKFYSADKVYHGYVIPLATSLPRVSIDPRAGVAHIAAADADAGHFY